MDSPRSRRGCVLPLAAVLAAALAAASCGPRSGVTFNVDNARAHVERLAGTIGPRPAGTAANLAARTYLIDQLRLYGFDVRVQEVDATLPGQGYTARVANLIATRPGDRAEAIALVAHHDSRPQAPGAQDDGIGVAVALEAARVLAARPRPRHSLVVLLTDAEELGLMGAEAAVGDPELRARITLLLNLEAVGGSGPAFLFEAGPGNEPLVRAWAEAAPRPRGSSYAREIYARLPNDTDFSVFRRAGIPGLNLAPVGDSYAYHTSRDLPDRVAADTLRHMGETAVATVQALDGRDLPAERRDVRFSDILGRQVIVLADWQGRLLAIAAVILGLLAWLRLLRHVASAGMLHLVSTLGWGVLSLASAAGAMVGAAWLLRAVHTVYHPWYGAPRRFLFLLVVCGALAPWYMTRLAWLLPGRARYVRAPESVWALVLPAWCLLTAGLEWTAPAASHVFALPLLVAGTLLSALPPAQTSWLRAVSAVLLLVSAAVLLPDALTLFRFLIAVFGRLPFVTPTWALPAFVAVVGLMVAPPFVAAAIGLIRGRTGHGVVGALLLAGFAIALAVTYAADAYTPERPLRRSVVYVHDQIAGQAWWEVAGNEPGLDLDLAAPDAARWSPIARGTSRPASAPVPAAFGAFRFTGPAAAAPPPATVVARTTPAPDIADHVDYEVVVSPQEEGLTASLVLPPGLVPTRATPAGVQPRDRWRSTYAAVPATGISFRLRFPASAAAALAGVAVTIAADTLPGGAPRRLPAWLPQARTAWDPEARWIVSPAAAAELPTAPVEPVVPVAPAPPATLPGALPGTPPGPPLR